MSWGVEEVILGLKLWIHTCEPLSKYSPGFFVVEPCVFQKNETGWDKDELSNTMSTETMQSVLLKLMLVTKRTSSKPKSAGAFLVRHYSLCTPDASGSFQISSVYIIGICVGSNQPLLNRLLTLFSELVWQFLGSRFFLAFFFSW